MAEAERHATGERAASARRRTCQPNAPAFDARAALPPSLEWTSLKSRSGAVPRAEAGGECGTDLTAWPSAKHSRHGWRSHLTTRFPEGKCCRRKRVAPAIGRRPVAPRRRRRGSNRHRSGAFYRRLSARVGKAKAITATARKMAVLFYNTLRHGMTYADPGAAYGEDRYKQRVLHDLEDGRSHWDLPQEMEPDAARVGVSGNELRHALT